MRVAQAFNIEVDLITISNDRDISESLKKASDRAEKMMRRSGVRSKAQFVKGELVDTLVDFAKEDHIIIMGKSSHSPITKFFLGSKPLEVMQSCQCPVLIVK